jgi:hypothetical protein
MQFGFTAAQWQALILPTERGFICENETEGKGCIASCNSLLTQRDKKKQRIKL